MKPFNKFKELRKVEIEVDGLYLKTKMLEFVAMEKDADPKKSKGIQSNWSLEDGILWSIWYNIEDSNK